MHPREIRAIIDAAFQIHSRGGQRIPTPETGSPLAVLSEMRRIGYLKQTIEAGKIYSEWTLTDEARKHLVHPGGSNPPVKQT